MTTTTEPKTSDQVARLVGELARIQLKVELLEQQRPSHDPGGLRQALAAVAVALGVEQGPSTSLARVAEGAVARVKLCEHELDRLSHAEHSQHLLLRKVEKAVHKLCGMTGVEWDDGMDADHMLDQCLAKVAELNKELGGRIQGSKVQGDSLASVNVVAHQLCRLVGCDWDSEEDLDDNLAHAMGAVAELKAASERLAAAQPPPGSHMDELDRGTASEPFEELCRTLGVASRTKTTYALAHECREAVLYLAASRDRNQAEAEVLNSTLVAVLRSEGPGELAEAALDATVLDQWRSMDQARAKLQSCTAMLGGLATPTQGTWQQLANEAHALLKSVGAELYLLEQALKGTASQTGFASPTPTALRECTARAKCLTSHRAASRDAENRTDSALRHLRALCTAVGATDRPATIEDAVLVLDIRLQQALSAMLDKLGAPPGGPDTAQGVAQLLPELHAMVSACAAQLKAGRHGGGA